MRSTVGMVGPNRPPLSLRNSAPDRTQRKPAVRSLAIRPSLVMVTATPRSPRSAWRFLAQEMALRVQLRHVRSSWRAYGLRYCGLHVDAHECLRCQVFPHTSTPVKPCTAGGKVIAYFYNHRVTVKLWLEPWSSSCRSVMANTSEYPIRFGVSPIQLSSVITTAPCLTMASFQAFNLPGYFNMPVLLCA